MAAAVAAAVTAVSAAPEGSVVGLAGLPGDGKSELAKAVDRAGAWPRRIVFDPYHARDLAERARGKRVRPWPGRVVTPAELGRRPSMLDGRRVRLVVSPTWSREEQLGPIFEAVAELAWTTGDITIVAEEAALYARGAQRLLKRVATGGRHAGLRLVLITQSLGEVAIGARRGLSHLVVWRQGEEGDLDTIRRRCGKEAAERVRIAAPGSPPLVWPAESGAS